MRIILTASMIGVALYLMFYLWNHSDTMEKAEKILPLSIISSVILCALLSGSLMESVVTRYFGDFPEILPIFNTLFPEYSDSSINIALFMSLMVALWGSFGVFSLLHSKFHHRHLTKMDMELCNELHKRMDRISKEMDWSKKDSHERKLFTPIEAEIEEMANGKIRRRYESLLDFLNRNMRKNAVYLVLGKPGSGKSVTLRKLCLELLNKSKRTSLIPIYIDLKKWSRDWESSSMPGHKELRDFIRSQLLSGIDDPLGSVKKYVEESFDEMLNQGRFYFIFDSFDEMPCFMGTKGTKKRPHMIQDRIEHISKLLHEFLKHHSQNGGVIASRYDNRPSDDLRFDKKLLIQPFDDSRIRKMLGKYIPDIAKDVEEKLFGKREDLVSICRNPFCLTLLISYVENKATVTLPASQMDLYSDFLRVRLAQCAGRIERKGLSQEKVREAAKTLAHIMQESAEYGIEYPVSKLPCDTVNWKDTLSVLEEARICRCERGDIQNGFVTFAHRRFQEFCLVEYMIQHGQEFQAEEYERIILHDGDLREALILYCEVGKESKVKEIACFCWNTVRKYIKNKNKITKECIYLIDALNFMTEAFYNRKDALSDFAEDFERLVSSNLDNDAEYVVQRAFVDSMTLKPEHLAGVILQVFQLGNPRLNDYVMQKCRFRLLSQPFSLQVELVLCEYFHHLYTTDNNAFRKSFQNTQFSLSVWKSLTDVKRFHFWLLRKEWITNSARLIMLIGVGSLYLFTLLAKFNMTLIPYMIIFFLHIVLKRFRRLSIALPEYMLRHLREGVQPDIKVYLIDLISMSFRLTFEAFLVMFGAGALLIWLINSLLANFYNQNTDLLNESLNILAGIFVITVCAIVFTLLVKFLRKITQKLFLQIPAYWKYRLFVKRLSTSTMQSISRLDLASNLYELAIVKWQQKYVEYLQQEQIRLTGTWPHEVRPRYEDKALDSLLSEMDYESLKKEQQAEEGQPFDETGAS